MKGHSPVGQFTKKVIFIIDEIDRFFETQSSFAEDEAAHLSGTVGESDHISPYICIIEGDLKPALIVPHCRVEPEFDLCLKAAIKSEVLSLYECCRDGWVVADLLSVEERSVDDALVGLADDGVEGLVATDVAGGAGERELDDLFEPL